MAVSYKPLMHMMIERDISNAELMRRASISANIITKIKNGQYIALGSVNSFRNLKNLIGPLLTSIEKACHDFSRNLHKCLVLFRPSLDKVESICSAMNCTPNDMMEFIPDQPKEEEDHD